MTYIKKEKDFLAFIIDPKTESAQFRLTKHELRPCMPALSFYAIIEGEKREIEIKQDVEYDMIDESESTQDYYGKINIKGLIYIAADTPFPLDIEADPEPECFFSIEAFIGESGEIYEEDGQDYPSARVFFVRQTDKNLPQEKGKQIEEIDDGLPF